MALILALLLSRSFFLIFIVFFWINNSQINHFLCFWPAYNTCEYSVFLFGQDLFSSYGFANEVIYFEWPLDSIFFYAIKAVEEFIKWYKSNAFSNFLGAQLSIFVIFYENHSKRRVWVILYRRYEVSYLGAFHLNINRY